MACVGLLLSQQCWSYSQKDVVGTWLLNRGSNNRLTYLTLTESDLYERFMENDCGLVFHTDEGHYQISGDSLYLFMEEDGWGHHDFVEVYVIHWLDSAAISVGTNQNMTIWERTEYSGRIYWTGEDEFKDLLYKVDVAEKEFTITTIEVRLKYNKVRHWAKTLIQSIPTSDSILLELRMGQFSTFSYVSLSSDITNLPNINGDNYCLRYGRVLVILANLPMSMFWVKRNKVHKIPFCYRFVTQCESRTRITLCDAFYNDSLGINESMQIKL